MFPMKNIIGRFEEILAELLKTAPEGYTPMYYEVIETRPLG